MKVIRLKILVIAAHPDDEVLGCGGTIAKLTSTGNDVCICIISEGASAQYSDPGFIDLRRSSAKKAAETLGARRIRFFDFKDMKLDMVPHVDINRTIEQIIDEEHPQIIYTHSPHDINKDHRIIFESTLVAARPFRREVAELISYEIPGTYLYPFDPNYYEDITSTLEIKLAAFKNYVSEVEQSPRPRSLETITAWAAVRGSQAGLKYAESFTMVRKISK